MHTKPPTFRSAVMALLGSLSLSAAKVGAVTVGVGLLLSFILVSASCACSTKEKAYTAAMKSDLRNLVSAEEAYYADHETYTASKSDLYDYYASSVGVSIHIDQATADGWSGSAIHSAITTQCAIFVGDVEPPASDAQPSAPYCWES